MINKVILVGYLGADPELRHTAGGKSVAELRLATTFGYGEKETTEWHRVIAWEKTADAVAAYTKKGSLVYVDGRIQQRSYDDKDGNKRYITEIVANEIKFLSRAGDKGGEAEDKAPF